MIKITSGVVNISGIIKKTGTKLKMDDADEKRLVDLGFAQYIDKDENIEVIDDTKSDGKTDNKATK